jgi:hypothetical protein
MNEEEKQKLPKGCVGCEFTDSIGRSCFPAGEKKGGNENAKSRI